MSVARQLPITFSREMVQAIVDGRKRVTRRVLQFGSAALLRNGGAAALHQRYTPGEVFCVRRERRWYCHVHPVRPNIWPGDTLWVREAWRVCGWDLKRSQLSIEYADGSRRAWRDVQDAAMFDRIATECVREARDARAPGLWPDARGRFRWPSGKSPCRWRSARFMPRWASRLQLRVTHVRPDRLQHMSFLDFVDEGFTRGTEFIQLWDRLNGSKGFDYAANPLVFVIGFTIGR